MLKLRQPLPKRKRDITINISSPEDKAKKAKLENERNKSIASLYFTQVPSIQNLVKGVYYWSRGSLFGDSENPDDYKVTTGTAPVTGVTGTAASAMELGINRIMSALKNTKYTYTKLPIPIKNPISFSTLTAGKISNKTSKFTRQSKKPFDSKWVKNHPLKNPPTEAPTGTAKPTSTGDKKPELPKRKGIINWTKNNPWKAGGSAVAATIALYPTRKYGWNYAGPIIGNSLSYITTGETPFNIPTVANDSTDLWYKGKVGKVGILQKDIVSNTNPVSLDSVKSDTVKTTPLNGVIPSNTNPLEELTLELIDSILNFHF